MGEDYKQLKEFILEKVGRSHATCDYERLTEDRAKRIARYATVTEYNPIDLTFEIIFSNIRVMQDMDQESVFFYVKCLIEEIEEEEEEVQHLL